MDWIQSQEGQTNLNQFWEDIMIRFVEKVVKFVVNPKVAKSDFLNISAPKILQKVLLMVELLSLQSAEER